MHPKITALLVLLLAACSGGGGASLSVPPAPPPPPPAGSTDISAVQGAAATSPLDGQQVTIEGIVTGDFQDNDADTASNLGGFFVQAEMPDGDATTSDGIFVFDGSAPATDVDVGDSVQITGAVQEYFGETQVAASAVAVTGAGMIQPIDLNLPVAATATNSDGETIADLERYEGMLVRFPQVLSVTELFNLERYGEVRLSQGGRLSVFTNLNPPDAVGFAAHLEAGAARSILLDDGQNGSNIAPIRYLNAGPAPNEAIRVGDTATGITGVLRYSRGSGGGGTESWRLMPVSDPVFASANPRPGAPSVGGSLTVTSFNVLNYFSTIDSGQSVCGPNASSNCRGADSAAELSRQIAKITAALVAIDADIAGLNELENNASDSLQDIVDALNASLGAGTYDFIDTGAIGSGSIKVGFIFKPSTVSLVGNFALLTSSVDARFNDSRSRRVLAQTFSQQSNGAVFTVAVNHLKSKGSPCDDIGDPDTGDGQGNCNQTRTNAAAALADWLALDPTGSGDPDFMIIGDLNAYLEEDPITTLEGAGYTNLVQAGGNGYSFVFRGQAGALDHALVTQSLVPQVTGTVEWHINADEAPVHDYNLENGRDPAIFDAATPWRASDHDPIVIGLELTN